MTEFLEELECSLCGALLHPNAPRENDLVHARRLIRRGSEIKERCGLEFDVNEYVAACLLHEVDRSYSLASLLLRLGSESDYGEEKTLKKIGIEKFVREKLRPSEFSAEAVDRIVTTVLTHSKFADDLESDPHVLTALRIADKLDRMGPYGICTAIIHRCPALPLFDPTAPFRYTSSVEGKLGSAYNDWMRVFEWYKMLPFDSAREMIREEFRKRIDFVRQIAAEYATNLGIENLVEADLQTALGKYYPEFA